MSDDVVKKEEVQLYKTDELELSAFLVARGCRMQERALRDDNRVDFTISGDKTFSLVKEFEMSSPNTLVPVHDLFKSLRLLRDTCTRIKRETAKRR
jgi:hypothetical protein